MPIYDKTKWHFERATTVLDTQFVRYKTLLFTPLGTDVTTIIYLHWSFMLATPLCARTGPKVSHLKCSDSKLKKELTVKKIIEAEKKFRNFILKLKEWKFEVENNHIKSNVIYKKAHLLHVLVSGSYSPVLASYAKSMVKIACLVHSFTHITCLVSVQHYRQINF